MKHITIDRTLTVTLYSFLLLLLSTTANIINVETQIISIGLIGISTYLLFAIIKRKGIYLSQLKLFTPYILFIFLYAINILYNFDSSAFNNLIFYITYGIFLFVISNVNWESFHLKSISLVSYIGVIMMFYLLFVKVDNTINTNVIGITTFALLFFLIINIVENRTCFKKLALLLISIICLYIIYQSGSRSVLLGITFTLLTYLLWNVITKSKFFYNLYFIIISIFIFSYTVIYPNLHKLLTNFDELQFLVIKYTGKAIYSGRNRIWEIILNKIYEKPFLGHGAGTLASDFIGTNQSSHNLFLEITLQVGILGVLLFSLYLFNIWNLFWKNKDNKIVIITASFFIGVLIHQVNEVLLIKSAISINLLIWMAFGIGLSYCYNKTTK